jgi:putative DNA primase/helicase
MIEEFKAAMQAVGIEAPRHIISDGKLHRFHIDGDKSGTLNGVYIFHSDGNPSGWFSNWRGTSGRWSSCGIAPPFTSKMRRQLDQQLQQREIEQQLRYQHAATTALYIWNKSIPATQHPYLAHKRVKPHHVRLFRDTLLVPIYDASRELVNLQFIQGDGSKRFLSGARLKDCYSAIRKNNNTDTILLCEGFSTAASLHEATKHYVAIGFSASSLLAVSLVIRNLYPQSTIIVCGDNDANGVGQKAAINAAAAVNGKYKIPPIAGQDWNDVLSHGGNK